MGEALRLAACPRVPPPGLAPRSPDGALYAARVDAGIGGGGRGSSGGRRSIARPRGRAPAWRSRCGTVGGGVCAAVAQKKKKRGGAPMRFDVFISK